MKKFGATPKHLKGASRQLWIRLRSDFNIEDGAGLVLLQAACEAFQRTQEARAMIEKEGAVIMDRFNQAKLHPAVIIEQNSRAQMISALRALKLAPEDMP
jgi:P27 family predicted phage terminase small subunit